MMHGPVNGREPQAVCCRDVERPLTEAPEQEQSTQIALDISLSACILK
jgi:hypothetical protein